MFSSNNIWVTKHKYNLFPQLWNTELFSATPPPAAASLPSNGYGDINLFYGCFFNSLHFTTSTPFIEVKCSSFYSWELKSKSGITELKRSGILCNFMHVSHIPTRKVQSWKITQDIWHHFPWLFTKPNMTCGVPQM